ncbi:MAG: hypothetical protein BGO10_04060 [Chlamydia sp. 32-24]|nr:MAG: hypothetical protein BGO10_04060 [Chlamydia sp. 32-24]
MNILPNETLFQIGAFLEPNDLQTCCQLSKKYNVFFSDDRLWKKVGDVHQGLHKPENVNYKHFYHNYSSYRFSQKSEFSSTNFQDEGLTFTNNNAVSMQSKQVKLMHQIDDVETIHKINDCKQVYEWNNYILFVTTNKIISYNLENQKYETLLTVKSEIIDFNLHDNQLLIQTKSKIHLINLTNKKVNRFKYKSKSLKLLQNSNFIVLSNKERNSIEIINKTSFKSSVRTYEFDHYHLEGDILYIALGNTIIMNNLTTEESDTFDIDISFSSKIIFLKTIRSNKAQYLISVSEDNIVNLTDIHNSYSYYTFNLSKEKHAIKQVEISKGAAIILTENSQVHIFCIRTQQLLAKLDNYGLDPIEKIVINDYKITAYRTSSFLAWKFDPATFTQKLP